MKQSLGRLQKDAQIKTVLKRGKSASSAYLTLKWIQNKEKGARCAFIVSLKVDKRAVVRNRVRRILREFLRGYFQPESPQIDLVIITRPGIASLDNKEIRSELEKILKRSTV